MLKRLLLRYSGDFGEDKTAQAVYAQLSERGFNPLIELNYHEGYFTADFLFDDGDTNLGLEKVLTEFEIPSSVKIHLINVNSGVV